MGFSGLQVNATHQMFWGGIKRWYEAHRMDEAVIQILRAFLSAPIVSSRIDPNDGGEPNPKEKGRIVCTTLNGCDKQKGLMISVLPNQGKTHVILISLTVTGSEATTLPSEFSATRV